MAVVTAANWRSRFTEPDSALRRLLERTYGRDALPERLLLFRRVIARFLERFGDRPVRMFRAPGRINLRGMHVDTHGGYLNLMTHQREVVAAVSPASDDTVNLANLDPDLDEVFFRIENEISDALFRLPWLEFITHPRVREAVDAKRGHWGNYVKGCILNVQHRFPNTKLKGMTGVVGSDLPGGAALSSSAALCLALTQATLSINGLALERDKLITAARDAEWFTGSRCGLSDQAAIVLGNRGEFANIAIYPPKLETASARRVAFPETLRILVINSHTERSLSGAAQVDYTRNRFAYSLAMEILRQEMRLQGAPTAVVEKMDRLSNITPEVLMPMGGMRTLLAAIKRIPETARMEELRSRYDLPEFDDAYQRCFGSAPEHLRPTDVALRGPLLFGIAESERARLFPNEIEAGDFDAAGRLMSVGHDGDRRVRADGSTMRCPVDDEAIDRLIGSGARIELFPGAYGASTPALDALVDAALDGGALGASLTGAGMAGAVLALCRAEDADCVAQRVRAKLASPEYQRVAGRTAPLSDREIAEAVVPNSTVASAGEFRLDP
jgi:galactokinase